MAARILVIEDNVENLEVMSCLLEAFGHTVLLAHDGEEGLKNATMMLPDLIICDLRLPKVNGFDLCRQIKEQQSTKEIPVVAVTAQAMVGDRERVLDAGFSGYISKPINPRSFVKEIESYLPALSGTEACHG